MADRTQNITINYKFNTGDLDRHNALLNKANQASNNLQQTAAKGGSAIYQEFQKSNRTILDMQTALTRLKSIIDVTSNPQKLKQLSNEYKNIKTQLDAATKSAYGLDNALKNQGNGVSALAGKFGQLYSAVQTVIGAAVVRQVGSMTLEMARLAGNAEGIERAFERAFPNSVQILGELRAATHGTVTDMELMQRTLQATNLGVAVKELPVLFEFAAVRAQQTGESVDYLVDSIVRGIGRKSPLILDNLGLSATALKEKFNGAALASQSVADVTRGVAEIAREELEKMGGHVETGATIVAQLEAAWTQLRITFAKRIDSSGIINFFKEAFQGMTNALKTEKEIAAEQAKQRASIEFQSLREHQLNEIRKEGGRSVKQTTQELVNATQNEIRERMKLIEASKVELEILKERFDQASHTKDNTAAQINDNIKIREQIVQQGLGVKANLKFYEETVKLLKAYSDELLKSNETEEESTGIIERKKEEIKKLQEAIEKTNVRSDLGVGGRLIKQLEIAQSELSDLQRAFTDFTPIEFENEIKNATKTLSDISPVIARIEGQLAKGFTPPPPQSVYTATTWDKLADDFIENWRDITAGGIDIQADQLKSLADQELNTLQIRLDNLQNFYDEQMSLAGDNDRAKEQLRIREERETTKLRNEMARKEKQARRTHVLIDIAAGIAKAFATYVWPYSLIPAAFVAAQGAAQLAIINRQPSSFAKGVIDLKGPGTSTSDSIPANLSRGESVMTAWETRHAGDVLREIRAKQLDNQKLRELKQGRPAVAASVDTQGIIKAIKDQKHPDIVKTSNIVYESKKYTDEYKKRVRSSSMSI